MSWWVYLLIGVIALAACWGAYVGIVCFFFKGWF